MANAEEYLEQLIAAYRAEDGIEVTEPTADEMYELANRRIAKAIDLHREIDDPGAQYIGDAEIAKHGERLLKAYSPHLEEGRLERGRRRGDALLQPYFADMIRSACMTARECGYSVDDLGVIGVLPVGTPNAIALSVPESGETLVLFQRGLPLVLNRLTKIVLSLDCAIDVAGFADLKIGEDGWQLRYRAALSRAAQSSPELAERFLGLMIATVAGGNPNAARPHQVSLTVAMLRAFVLSHMELFIIGHEIGHAVFGHLAGNCGTSRAMLAAGSVSAAVLTPQQSEELAADVMGYLIADTSAAKNADEFGLDIGDFAFCAPDFFFSCIAQLEDFMSLAHSGWSPADTHPPAASRRDARRGFLINAESERALLMGERLQLAIEELAALARPRFIEFVAKGGAGSHMWAGK